ncbi:MAG: hypothetical protein JWQ35_200 [Bacteriovoracaceae bacterium]|nr:hypothetical protein [Bacteriovoracaceae bacterium]
MNSNLLTNTLLVIIAVLLLVQVIQTGVNQPAYSNRPIISSHTESQEMEQAPVMQTNMIFQAVKAFPAGCAGKAVLAECSSPEAEAVKAQIEKFQSTGAGIRQTFDYIVTTFGEKVLTDQALQIRKMRKKN